ncbi:ABC transporter ATP-binding protein [Paraglaciecola aquimarina]|uniref:ABC transporter ATP-binding protein n=1 Tax=Paraglaciecola algarum TaxID=3050085 RepID=A0ABS9D3K5_9ALTE|nr:ABC transporter ATP-binding protein [Paraglaciecola sp. G1-23]MCF2946980.1 ABC transporter ATP-binding protein [Paraglaciecola sp. G1-23]
MNPHVKFSQVGHTYTSENGQAVCALKGINFNIYKNEFIAVLGPSGCGKSTLLRLLSGLYEATMGEVSIFGTKVTEPQSNTGIVFQKPTLLPWKNILQNVVFPIQHKQGRVSSKDIESAKAMLKLVGLEEFAQHMPNQLSGGMQQRVGIARALLMDPEILIMDEPFSALDALTREEMGFELLNIWRQKPKTVLFITHSISEAVLLADRVLVLSPRPASVIGEIKIDLPRPRNIDSIKTSEFSEYTDQIRQLIYRPETQTENQESDLTPTLAEQSEGSTNA